MSRIKLRDARRDLAGLPGPKDPADIDQLVIDDLNEADTARLREVLRNNRNGQLFHRGGLLQAPNDNGLLRILPDGRALPAHVAFDPAQPGSDRTTTTSVMTLPGGERINVEVRNLQIDWGSVGADLDDLIDPRPRRMPTSGTVTGRLSSGQDAWHALQEAFRGVGRAVAPSLSADLRDAQTATAIADAFAANRGPAALLVDSVLEESDRALRRELGDRYIGQRPAMPDGGALARMLDGCPYLSLFRVCRHVTFWGSGARRICMAEMTMHTAHVDERPGLCLMVFCLGDREYRATFHEYSTTDEYNRLVGGKHLHG